MTATKSRRPRASQWLPLPPCPLRALHRVRGTLPMGYARYPDHLLAYSRYTLREDNTVLLVLLWERYLLLLASRTLAITHCVHYLLCNATLVLLVDVDVYRVETNVTVAGEVS